MARLQHALVLGLGDHVTATAAPAAAAGADTATAATAEPAGAAPSSSASSSGGAADGGSDGFNTAAGGLKFLLVAGAPINEPIVQQG
jgi:redox-sensitive bicupin YhaK (pirin superfamily)